MAQHNGEPVRAGREDQFQRVRELLKNAAAGHGASLLVDGEPGSGKSTLLGLVAEEATRLRCRVFAGAARETGPAPLGALLDCLEPDLPTEDIRRAAQGGGPPAGAVRRFFALIAQVCRTAPVVLVLDNLHQADDASQLVWRRLTEAAARRPLLLVAATRGAPGAPLPPAAARAAADAGAARLTLAPLGLCETARHAERVLGAPPGPRLLRRLGDTGGNARHLGTLLAALAGAGAVRVTADTAELDPAGAPDTPGLLGATPLEPRPGAPDRTAPDRSAPGRAADDGHLAHGPPYPLPPALAAALTDRLGPLSPDARTLVRVAALLDAPFPRTELAVALDRAPEAPLPALGEALAAGVVEETEPPQHRLRFRDELTRQAVWTGVPATVRAALHGRTARSLAALGAPAHRVAAHLLPADRTGDDWATDWLLRHLGELLRHHPRAVVGLAARHLHRVPPEDPGHARLQDAAAHAAYLLGLPDAVTRARELYDRAADPARRSRLGFLTALALLQDGRPAQAHPLVDEALAVHALPGRPARTARFLALRAALLCGGRRLDEARTLADQALERSLAVRAPVAEAYARSVRAQLLTHAGDHPAALRESVRARTAARRRAETRDIQLVQTLLGAHLLGVHDRDGEARALLEEARALADSTGSPARKAWAHTVSARFHYRAGHWDEALDDLDLGRSLPAPWQPSPPYGLDAVILVGRDRRDAARAALTAARAAAPAGTDPGYLPLAEALLAERDGDPHGALAALRDALCEEPPGRWSHRAFWLPDTVRIALALGDRTLAATAVTLAGALADTAPGERGPRALAQRCRGLAEGEPGALRAAADHYQRQGMRLCLARTQEDLAAVLAAQGDTDGARRGLNHAVDLYQLLAAHWYTARADARLRALGVRRGPRGARGRPRTGTPSPPPN
ncbi:AAA family ATPase [Streptomyces clavuligerus]|uniref:AAA family ATPase n=1 Tax=Streptomyces clavuligerus TaxID=1901 RepID=UPI000AB18AE5|nr:ATP-binding protein [Streptomyces clavuligerus]